MKKLIIPFIIFAKISLAVSADNSVVLDTVMDEYVSSNDPRIGSIILANTDHKYVQVKFNGIDGKTIATNLSKIFIANKINYELVEDNNTSTRKVIINVMKSKT